MTSQLKYNGKIYLKNALSEKEVKFLNYWQQQLVEIFSKSNGKSVDSVRDNSLNQLFKFKLSPAQTYEIYLGFSPHISFTEKYINVQGTFHKGNLREALLSYHHLFFSKSPFMKHMIEEFNISPNSFKSGEIEGMKTSYNKNSQYCYFIKNNKFYSSDAPNLERYHWNETDYPKKLKEDNYLPRFIKSFPILITYHNVKEAVSNTNTKNENNIKKVNKI